MPDLSPSLAIRRLWKRMWDAGLSREHYVPPSPVTPVFCRRPLGSAEESSHWCSDLLKVTKGKALFNYGVGVLSLRGAIDVPVSSISNFELD